MKNILVVIILVLAVFFSCKKKDDPAPSNNSTTGSTTSSSTTGGTTGATTTGGSTTGGTTGTPTSTATSFHGILSIMNFTSQMSGQNVQMKTGSAYFSETPVQFMGSSSVRVKKLTLNGDSLILPANGSQYSSMFPANMNGSKWVAEGANGFPSFTFDATFAEPTCTNLNLVPASVSRSAGLNLSFTVANAKKSLLMLADNNGNLAGSFAISLTNGANSIHFTSAQLSVMDTTMEGQFMIQMENTSNHLIGGKDISFKKELIFMKQVVIKN